MSSEFRVLNLTFRQDFNHGVNLPLKAGRGFSATQFGLSADKVTPADYDGDGKTDAAVYRDGTWWIRQSTNGIAIQQFGLGSDKPIPSTFLP